MIAQTQLKKPSNWQDFEKLCKLLWGEIWSCEDSIKRHGRQGQNQHGVDVFSYVEKYGGYCGIQCKGKDDYTNAQLTEGEIDKEIEKALGFEPKLKLLVFATTANKDAKIEGYIRKKDVENRKKGLFAVDIASWDDIVDQLERYKTTYNWYVNNCQFKDTTDVSVSFWGEEEITVHPEYIRVIKHYEYKELTPLEQICQAQLKDLKAVNFDASIMFQTYKNQLEYIPKNSVFVQKDYRDFQMSIIPADGIKRLPLIWRFLCEDYQKEGYLTINVDPQIEDRIETIEVHDKSKLKPDEVTIEAKIIEK